MDGLKERLRALRESRATPEGAGKAAGVFAVADLVLRNRGAQSQPAESGRAGGRFGVTADYLLGRTPPEPGTGSHRAHRGAAGGGGGDRPGHAPAERRGFPGEIKKSLPVPADREGEKSCGAGVSAYWADPCAGTAR